MPLNSHKNLSTSSNHKESTFKTIEARRRVLAATLFALIFGLDQILAETPVLRVTAEDSSSDLIYQKAFIIQEDWVQVLVTTNTTKILLFDY